MDLKDTVCIVTGASSGIGEAVARLFACEGAKVALVARRADRLEALAAQLPGSLAVVADVTVAADRRRVIAETAERLGALHVLVNNAGQGLHVPLEEVRAADLRAVLELNVVAPLELMQGALPMLRASRGSIVNLSSATTLHPFPGIGAYVATKAALNVLSQVGRMEWASSGVAVSIVYPRVTATEFHSSLRAGRIAPGARGVEPDEPALVARAVRFAVEHRDAHVMVDSPPRALELGVEGASAFRSRG